MTGNDNDDDNDDVNNNQAAPPLADPFYPDPEWARLPGHKWTLTEIKGGVQMADIDLSTRPCWLLGRAADQVHIPMQHESCSRCHARIAFDQNGTPWLRDCRSTHHTFVNKKPLPPEASSSKEEPTDSTKKGSRGVVLYPGDVVKFGASTRIYCIEGPPEFQRGSIRIAKLNQNTAQLQKQQQAIASANDSSKESKNDTDQQQPTKDDGISWGISMAEAGDYTPIDEDEENSEQALLRQKALEDGDAIPDKHRKSWEKICALKYKLNNLQTESQRIRCKGDELTAGQERQLEKNAKREIELSEQINQREKDLYEKLHPDKASEGKAKRNHQAQNVGDEDDVDDFFDRTKDQDRQGNQTEDAETEESLLAKWNNLQQSWQQKNTLLQRGNQKIIPLQQRLDRLQATGDDEAFFAQNDVNLAKEQITKVESEVQTIDKALEETKRLLKIVNPKIVLEDKRLIQQDPSPPLTSMAPPPPMAVIAGEAVSSIMPPPMRKPSHDDKQTATNKDNLPDASDGNGEFVMPPPKRKRTVGPTLPPPASVEGTDRGTSNAIQAKGPSRGPAAPIGTLAALTASSNSSKEKKAKGPSKGPPGPTPSSSVGKQGWTLPPSESSKPQEPKQATTIDLEKDEWRAPKDQDGSGRTKLNAKFAGRY